MDECLLFTEREAFIELADAALAVQEETGAHIFIDYSPHCHWFGINVYPNQWEQDVPSSEGREYNLNTEFGVRDAFRFIALMPKFILWEQQNKEKNKEKQRQERIAYLRARIEELEGRPAWT